MLLVRRTRPMLRTEGFVPFYAFVEALSGDILDVVESLDEPPPAGAIVVELPAREDDIRSWLARWRKDRGGGSGGEVFVEREDADAAGGGGRSRDITSDAEQFFTRLDQEINRAQAGQHRFAVLLFDVAPQDREEARPFVDEVLQGHGVEVLACDLVCRVRVHLVAVIMPESDGPDRPIVPPRGAVYVLAWPKDREALEQLRQRKHPILRRSIYRTEAAGRGAA